MLAVGVAVKIGRLRVGAHLGVGEHVEPVGEVVRLLERRAGGVLHAFPQRLGAGS